MGPMRLMGLIIPIRPIRPIPTENRPATCCALITPLGGIYISRGNVARILLARLPLEK